MCYQILYDYSLYFNIYCILLHFSYIILYSYINFNQVIVTEIKSYQIHIQPFVFTVYAGIPVTLIMDNYQDETVNRLYDIDKHKYSKTCLIQCLCNPVQCVIRLLFSFLFYNNPIFPPCHKKNLYISIHTFSPRTCRNKHVSLYF